MDVNLEAVTVQDCIDMGELKGAGVLLDNGRVAGFEYDRSTQTEGVAKDEDED